MDRIHCNMEHHHILEKIQIVKKNVMHILSEITVIEYQVHQLTLKHRSPPRKKHAPDGARAATSTTTTEPPKKEKKRIQPTQVNNNNELHRSYTMIPRPSTDFNALENQWHVRRAHTLSNQQPLEELGQKQYIESSDTNFPTEEGEASQLPDLDFEEGYAHKAKGHTRETVSQWFYRLKQVIDSGRNPILTVKGLEILFQKLSRTLKDIQKPNHKLLIDAINDFTIMKQLFRQLDGPLANATTIKLKT
jgi:hypothetical protein